jgi:hypothetical protein
VYEPPSTPAWDELERLAFYYASGEMEASEAAAFETRLAGEQPAREALAAAVALMIPLRNGQGGGPGRDYRQVVRQRLRQSSGSRITPATLTGHASAALFGGGAGALAASLVFMWWGARWFASDPPPALPHHVPVVQEVTAAESVALDYAKDSNREAIERLENLTRGARERKKPMIH